MATKSEWYAPIKTARPLTTAPADIAIGYMCRFLPSGIEFPGIGVQFGVEMDITKGIYNIGPGRDYFVVDVEFWAEIPPHRGVRLCDARRLADQRVEHGRLALPGLERYRREARGQRRLRLEVRRRIFRGYLRLRARGRARAAREERLHLGNRFCAPFRMAPKKCHEPRRWEAAARISIRALISRKRRGNTHLSCQWLWPRQSIAP